ncbi:MAG: YbhB/YbcL family Raf kinase inhibitor-like protein [Gammaproteobacteria bacterium]|nr:YbhB/YbcL family Raf kinase inhibitor-like protein [Gammaproteobacteria bacterium]
MNLFCRSFADGEAIPERFAFGAYDADEHVVLSENVSPGFYWSGLPEGTRSLVMICHDPDVPGVADDVNLEGRRVPEELPRVDFYHWVLVDIDADGDELAEGAFSTEVTAGGKPGPEGPHGTRSGINSYTDWFSGDPDMEGDYYGYDGPCPPWNDTLVHRYMFTLYALDTERCPVDGRFDGPEVLQAISGHVLDKARLCATYTLNPDLR